MDFVSIFHLTLAFLSTGWCYAWATEQSSPSCYAMCPPGYHKVGTCNGTGALYLCDKCQNNTFTAINNFITKCQRCTTCESNEEQVAHCTISSDTVCKCKKGLYREASDPGTCKPCKCQSCTERTVHRGKCQFCQRSECLDVLECKDNCLEILTQQHNNSTTTSYTSVTTSTTKLLTSITAATTVPASSSTKTTAVTPNTQAADQMSRLIIMGVMVALLVLFWLLFFTRTQLRYPDSCPCWSANKDPELPAEELKLNEQCSHQGSGSTTLTLNLIEETPIMTLSQSPATPEHPANSSPLRPDGEHKAARLDEPTEQWPAIVLYAIIKEVPLRRWKEFLRLLSVADQQLERVELEAGLGLGSMERQYQMLRLWSQRSTANLNDVFSALQYMDLSGCAQLLQESLEKLQWRPELNQGVTACRSHADQELSGEAKDT